MESYRPQEMSSDTLAMKVPMCSGQAAEATQQRKAMVSMGLYFGPFVMLVCVKHVLVVRRGLKCYKVAVIETNPVC